MINTQHMLLPLLPTTQSFIMWELQKGYQKFTVPIFCSFLRKIFKINQSS